ncbi:putative NADP(+)-dependent dehydrogenase [Hyaloscypha variabilis]
MSSDGLLVIGSGPGIGVTASSLFAQKKFTKIALISRDNTRLSKDRETILQAAKSAGKTIEVQTWSVDITNTAAFKVVLKETEKFATFSRIHFNAARVAPSNLLIFPEERDPERFQNNNHCHTISHWALPILTSLPSHLITSSLLPHDPVPFVFPLSLVKASQRNLAQSLALTYPDVHVALLNVGGPVSWEDRWFNPPAIAKKFWELYTQEKDKWTLDLDLLAEESEIVKIG